MKKLQYIWFIIFIVSISILIYFLKASIKEGLQNPLEFSFTNKFTSFCNTYGSSSIKRNSKCNELTNKNCNSTSCCVWSNDKCHAGNAGGLIYNTDSNGKTIKQDYFFQNQLFKA